MMKSKNKRLNPLAVERKRYDKNSLKINSTKSSEEFNKHVSNLSKPNEFDKLFEILEHDNRNLKKRFR